MSKANQIVIVSSRGGLVVEPSLHKKSLSATVDRIPLGFDPAVIIFYDLHGPYVPQTCVLTVLCS